MGAADLILGDESGWISSEFFAPASTDLVDGLMSEYRQMRGRIERMADVVCGDEYSGALRYFVSGNRVEGRRVDPMHMFDLEGAVASLNASFWSRAMDMTDVYDAMPQKRREEWNEAIREMTTPDFEEETVRATLQDLLLSRSKFFAERVDGIFRALSGEHVTNSPMGFGKRMILSGITSSFYTSTDRAGYINDLRAVIAKFMGRDEPGFDATAPVVKAARAQRGQWMSIDGGAIRIRCYANGNAHLEVHPDMAWRLNCVLAQMYPTAIPSQFRQKPKRVPKDVAVIQRPLPFSVLRLLEGLKEAIEFVDPLGAWNRRTRDIPMTRRFGYGSDDKHTKNEAERVLMSIGGVLTKDGHWAFCYEPAEVLREIVCSGCIPDQKSHQFYPTPERLAKIAVDLAEIGPDHLCLEPSAGTGGLADFMPAGHTRCVEISELHCKVLSAKGLDATQADFAHWATKTRDRFDRIVMNPPFDQGRWQAHLDAAVSLLTSDGRLVAILPASARNRVQINGCNCAWHGPYDNEFAGTGVSVVILVLEKQK